MKRIGVMGLVLVLLAGLFMVPTAASELVSTAWAYSQLTDELEKEIYTRIYEASWGENRVLEIQLSTPIVYTTAKRDEGIPADVKAALSGAQQTAVDALRLDNAGMFWLKGSMISYSSAGRGSDSTGWTWTLSTLTLEITVAVPYESTLEEVWQAQEEALAAIETVGETRYDRLKEIHDALVAQVKYDYTFVWPQAHDAVGALLDGKAVCEGYAKAFKLRCERAGIPCVLVTGLATGSGGAEAHMWNLVQMEDGKWYAVDVT